MEVEVLSPETIQDTVFPPTPSEKNTSTTPSITAVPIPHDLIDSTFATTTSLSTTVLGATILSFSDEWFASASNLLTPAAPIRRPGYFVHSGAWYDGWETRRHNRAEYDWVVIKLGCVGTIEGVEVDTAFFNGNEAPAAALDGVFLPEEDAAVNSGVEKEGFTGWREILSPQACGPSRRQAWRLTGPGIAGKPFTHLRLKMYPDGGIARLRVYGSAVPPPLPASSSSSDLLPPLEELSSALNGGVAISCSDQHFGVKSNLLLPGRGKDMGDGWETSRSRAHGHVDWVICRLGLKGRTIEKLVVDTAHFRGNYPQAVRVEGWLATSSRNDDTNNPNPPLSHLAAAEIQDPQVTDPGWLPLLQRGEEPCGPDREHVFEQGSSLAPTLQKFQPDGGDGDDRKVWSHVKMTIIPDGGVKRLRIWGRRA